LVESRGRFDLFDAIIAQHCCAGAVAEKETKRGKRRAIGIGGVSSTGDNLGAEASGYLMEARSREDDGHGAHIAPRTKLNHRA
jgi:hypothetical protein